MRVLFFAQIKDVTGCDSTEIELASPQNCEQLWSILIGKFPALENHLKNIRLARNWEYTDEQTLFYASDEAALIPPVSGG